MKRSRVVLPLVVSLALGVAARGTVVTAEPKPKSISYSHDALEHGLTRPVSRVFDPALLARKVSGHRRAAANVDEHGEVRLPSTWWQPRLGFRTVSVAQMLHGPGPGIGPAPGKWKVVKIKTQGVSPGFQIKDSQGVRFAIKFDPPGYPELATGADVVVSKLLWGAGYNVPDNAIVGFRREDLVIDSSATFTDASGHKRPITEAFLNHLLTPVPKNADSSYRAVASRFLSGKPLGEWEYSGRRKDDLEDLVPHQHRREVRGLWTIAAWLNHTDCGARNTLDLWVTDGGRSFVRHHLIDFSGCMGAASITPQTVRAGNEYLLDYGAGAVNLMTLGLQPPRWEHAIDPEMPSVGFFESRVFDPGDWRPFLPNPAFDERTDADVRWGARIVAGFTDEHIRAAVAEGRYSDPRAAEYLVRTLIERRDKITRRWLPERVTIPEGGVATRQTVSTPENHRSP
jgi:hypothetical protein